MIMLTDLAKIMSRDYFQTALIVGICMSLSASLLGVSLVLKKHSMIGDGLSHVGFGAVAVAACMGWAPLAFAIPVVIVSSFLILWLAEKSKVFGDSAIAVFSTLALAIGYAAIEVGEGVTFNVSGYLYGNILGVSDTEKILSIVLAIIVSIVFLFLYHRIFSVTFDVTFSKSTGTHTSAINITISILTSLMVVIGMKLIGALLITSLIIFPTLSARQIFKTFKNVTIFAVASSIVGFLIGLFMACLITGMPIGSAIVFSNFGICVISFIIGRFKLLYKKN
ncbi:MAG: metal ABC transporter permease [Acholeplasmatales bacterium]|nr:metal ABC transporter permease [Acholeplasmatales bacterium]